MHVSLLPLEEFLCRRTAADANWIIFFLSIPRKCLVGKNSPLFLGTIYIHIFRLAFMIFLSIIPSPPPPHTPFLGIYIYIYNFFLFDGYVQPVGLRFF